jgi:hypothetical protein
MAIKKYNRNLAIAMKNELTKQELHNLAMNIVGKDLEDNGFEFLGINSEFKRDPQFVALKDKKLHFVIVRAILYPDNPGEYDPKLANKVRDHAIKYNARTFYAGVGLANSTDYEKPIFKDEEYVINYSGLQEIE